MSFVISIILLSILIFIVVLILVLKYKLFFNKKYHYKYFKSNSQTNNPNNPNILDINNKTKNKIIKSNKKPPWVIKEVIKLKAYLPNKGCRYIAQVFNAKFGNISISKSFACYTIKKYKYDILQTRHKLKNKLPYNTKFNKTWAIDLTNINNNIVVAIIEHHSRLNIITKSITSKTSISLLLILIKLLKYYPKPQYIRTDNERCFNSRIFRLGLLLLGIKKQNIPPYSPWCNGRIERFFGTLKTALINIPNTQQLSTNQLQYLLHNFSFWYNNIRLHQNLGYKTPMEIYSKKLKIYNQKE